MKQRLIKKRIKQAANYARTNARKDGVLVEIKTQMFVDENGGPCSPNKAGARFIQMKRPQIKYIKRVSN